MWKLTPCPVFFHKWSCLPFLPSRLWVHTRPRLLSHIFILNLVLLLVILPFCLWFVLFPLLAYIFLCSSLPALYHLTESENHAWIFHIQRRCQWLCSTFVFQMEATEMIFPCLIGWAKAGHHSGEWSHWCVNNISVLRWRHIFLKLTHRDTCSHTFRPCFNSLSPVDYCHLLAKCSFVQQQLILKRDQLNYLVPHCRQSEHIPLMVMSVQKLCREIKLSIEVEFPLTVLWLTVSFGLFCVNQNGPKEHSIK